MVHTLMKFSSKDREAPEENVLGEVGQGYVNALKILTNGRAAMAARNLGSADKLLEMYP